MSIPKQVIINGLSKMGYTLVKTVPVKKFLSISDYSQAIYSRKDVFFEVETDIICNLTQFYFSSNNWHYQTKMVEELIENPNIKYKDSILRKYYESYRPKTIKDFYFYKNETTQLSKNDHLILNQDINKYKQNSPWCDFRELDNMDDIHEKGLKRFHGIQTYGPVSETKGELELQRLKNTLFSIRNNGFHPNKYDGHITGHFLKYKQHYRFLITGGVHRTAVLSALKYKHIPVTFEPNWPRVIDYYDIDNFPQVKNQTFSEVIAKKIFLSYFEDNGIGKAKRIGIL